MTLKREPFRHGKLMVRPLLESERLDAFSERQVVVETFTSRLDRHIANCSISRANQYLCAYCKVRTRCTLKGLIYRPSPVFVSF